MTVQKINIGARPNDQTGDDLRDSFAKTNAAIDQVNANTQEITKKVSSVAGKGLSSEDYTKAEKTKLAGVEDGAKMGWASKIIPSGSDLDEFLDEGPFKCSANAAVATLLNCPTNIAFSMEVFHTTGAAGSQGVIQRITEYVARPDRRTIERTRYNTWSAWIDVKPQAFGIGSTASPGNTDSNGLRTGGMFTSSAAQSAAAGLPLHVGHAVTHCPGFDGTGYQISAPMTSVAANRTRLFLRQLFSNQWTDQKEFAFVGDVPGEAPKNGKQYARKDGGWSEVAASAGGGVWGEITGNISNQADLAKALGKKVDAVTGKGLSSNDFTSQDKQKLEELSAGIAYTSVPGAFKSWMIAVTSPHLRIMVWDGAKYVRAPWHQPGMVMYSYDNPSAIPGYIPVRADVVYKKSDYPDLVARLGLPAGGNFSLVDARGEFLRVLDNGRGADTGRALRSVQGDAIRNITGRVSADSGSGATGAFSWAGSGANKGGGPSPFGATDFNAALVVPTANENRPRNIAFPLWISY